MLKKTIKYTNFNGEEVSEDFFFHLSKAELIEMEVSHEGGMLAFLERIIAAEDNAALIKEFKSIVLLSYGVRSLDGRRFTKSQALRDEFESTEAYSTLFMELITDTNEAIAFFNGIVPSDMTVEEAKIAGVEPDRTPLAVVADEPKPEPRVVTKAEMLAMSQDDFKELGLQLYSGEAVLVGDETVAE